MSAHIDQSFYDQEYFLQMEARYWMSAHGQRVRDIMSLLPAETARVLDFGAGSGYFSYRMRKAGHDVVAWDYADAARDFIRKHYQDVRVVDGVEELSQEKFGGVALTDVIEHLSHEEQGPFIEKLKGYMSPGAWLLLSTDNFESPFMRGRYERLTFLDGRLTKEGRTFWTLKKSELARPYFRKYTDSHIGLLGREGVISLLESAGFSLEREKHGFLYRAPVSSLVARLTGSLPLHSVYLFRVK